MIHPQEDPHTRTRAHATRRREIYGINSRHFIVHARARILRLFTSFIFGLIAPIVMQLLHLHFTISLLVASPGDTACMFPVCLALRDYFTLSPIKRAR